MSAITPDTSRIERPAGALPADEAAVATVILAAGASTRLGCPKQLLPWRGEPLVAHACRTALTARLGPVVVVIGHRASAIQDALAPLASPALPVAPAAPAPPARPASPAFLLSMANTQVASRLQIVVNADYRRGGQSSSMRLGVSACADGAAAVAILLVDMPLVEPHHLRAVAEVFRAARQQRGDHIIVVASHGGRRGHPVLFGRRFFPELCRLEGDEGARSLLKRYPEAVIEVPAGEEVLLDIDTWEDYASLLSRSPAVRPC